jgi:membrane dipeptidase
MTAHLKTIVTATFVMLWLALPAFVQVSRGEDAKKLADRAPVVLTDAARQLHSRSLVIDGHNDMPWEIRTSGSSS